MVTPKQHVDLKKHCSLKIGGYAKELIVPRDERELMSYFAGAKSRKKKCQVIGKGSNLLFLDEGYEGLIIKNTHACNVISVLPGKYGFLRNRRLVYVGASVPNQRLIKFCAKNNLAAPTFLQTIPGNIGGAIYMNAGTGQIEGRFFSDFIRNVRVFDGARIFNLSNQDCQFDYRKSKFMTTDWLILGCEIECSSKNRKKTLKEVNARIESAKAAQDDGYPNAGSVFNRGFNDIKAIREFQEGGARFSEKTCNWIINTNNASSSDVLRLIDRAIVEHHANSLATPELELIVIK